MSATEWTEEARKRSEVAIARVEDWAGADHFEDCPAIPHTDGECSCAEDACDEGESVCDCYLGAMRALQGVAKLALAEIDRLTAEVDEAMAERDREWVQACLFPKPPAADLTPTGAIALVLAEERKALREIVKDTPCTSAAAMRWDMLAALDARGQVPSRLTPFIADHRYVPGGGRLVGKCMFPLDGTATGRRCAGVESAHGPEDTKT